MDNVHTLEICVKHLKKNVSLSVPMHKFLGWFQRWKFYQNLATLVSDITSNKGSSKTTQKELLDCTLHDCMYAVVYCLLLIGVLMQNELSAIASRLHCV